MEGLGLLSALKRECPQSAFNVITIVLNDNLEELDKIAVFVRGFGADSLQFQPLLANNLRMAERKSAEFWIKTERLPELELALERLVRIKREIPGFIRNSEENLRLFSEYFAGTLPAHKVKCASAARTVLISNQGTCSSCFFAYGDIKRHNLSKILNGKATAEARAAVSRCAQPCLLPCFCDQEK